MTDTIDVLADLAARYGDAATNTEAIIASQFDFLGGTLDDPDSFDADGGKTGPLGFYPLINANEQVVYLPCYARMQADFVATTEAAIGDKQDKVATILQVSDFATGNGAYTRAAIQAAINALPVQGGTVVLNGGRNAVYGLDAPLVITGQNVELRSDGATIRQLVPLPFFYTVGNAETAVVTTEGNALAIDAPAGSMSITLATGKGAHLAEGAWVMLVSNGIAPGNDATNRLAQFVNVYKITGDVLQLSAPLTFGFLVADAAEIFRVHWIEGFRATDLIFDGNNLMGASAVGCHSFCYDPILSGITIRDVDQRGIRLQGCLGANILGFRDTNGLSTGFQGTVNKFSYAIIESGLNQGLIATDLHVERCRHGYTTGGGYATNAGVTYAGFNYGIPMFSQVSDGTHIAARGAGWDTHPQGYGIKFKGLRTVGGLYAGLQNRAVGTVIDDCSADDTIGPGIYNTSDAMDATIHQFSYRNTNCGIDDSTSTDWRQYGPIVDIGKRTTIGPVRPNLLINSDFLYWQRAQTFAASGFTADRWKWALGAGAAGTVVRSTATLGQIPVYARNFLRFSRTTTGTAPATISQKLEGVRTLAGKRACVSWYGRTDQLTVNLVDVYVVQRMGTGGTPSTDVVLAAKRVALDNTFRRKCAVFDLPDLTGATLGTNGDDALEIVWSLAADQGNLALDIAATKIEQGSVPTDYEVPDPIQSLAACQRYFEKSYNLASNPGTSTSTGSAYLGGSTAAANVFRQTFEYKARKRANPTLTLYSTTGGAGVIRNITQGTDIAATVANNGEASFNAGIATSTSVAINDVVAFHWVADAELT